MYKNFLLLSIILIYFLTGVFCETDAPPSQNTTKDYDEYVTEGTITYDPNSYYCLRFTWLGPLYDNSSVVNGTCNDLAAEKKLKNTPCKSPLVITYDGSPPNMTYLYDNYKDRILCRKAKGQSCIKYSYSFNNELQNITYMCAKAISEGEGPIKNSVCYKQNINGYVISSCICQPQKHMDPCFYHGSAPKLSTSILPIVTVLILVHQVVVRWY